MATAFPFVDRETEDPTQSPERENDGDQPPEDITIMDQSVPLTTAQLKEYLESNWNSLVNHLEVERIIPKFRAAHLFDRTDDERISSEYRNPTSIDKAGVLLDTVVRRGPKAIQLLFDHVEKQHPDLYKEITGREPRITRARMQTFLSQQRKKGGLPPGLTLTILTQLTEMMEDKEKQENELDQRNKELADRERKIQRLTLFNKKMEMKNKALLSKNEERDKLQTELTHRTTMLKDVQDKLLKYQREAEKAKHHARMATFKNFHLEYEVREMHNKMNIQRRQTRNLQRSVKNHEKWLNEHNISYTLDHRKVEELQQELEKIDDFRRSMSDEMGDISERVQSQLAQAKDTNEGLNLRLQRTQEKNEGLKGEIVLLKKERTMMRETMQMNRLHLQMSQHELEIVSRERVKLNQAYEEVLKDMSQSYLNTTSLQDRLNKVRLDYAELSERIMNAGDGSVDTSGIFPHGDASDESLDDDGTGADATEDLESGGDEDIVPGDAVVPVPRPRLKRIVSSTSSRGCRSDQMRALTESFDKGESSSSHSHTMTSSSSATTGDEDPTDTLDIGRISGFPDYCFRGSGDEEEDADDDDDDDDDNMAQRMSRLESDFDFMDHQSTAVRSRPRTRRHARLSGNRRSRSLSRLEDYENMEFLQPQGCYSHVWARLLHR